MWLAKLLPSQYMTRTMYLFSDKDQGRTQRRRPLTNLFSHVAVGTSAVSPFPENVPDPLPTVSTPKGLPGQRALEIPWLECLETLSSSSPPKKERKRLAKNGVNNKSLRVGRRHLLLACTSEFVSPRSSRQSWFLSGPVHEDHVAGSPHVHTGKRFCLTIPVNLKCHCEHVCPALVRGTAMVNLFWREDGLLVRVLCFNCWNWIQLLLGELFFNTQVYTTVVL